MCAATSDESTPAEQFSQLADLYEDMFEWEFRKFFEVPTVFNVIGKPTEKSFIDFGCGGGGYTRLLKKHGAAYITGYEPTAGMRDYARTQASQENLDINYISSIREHTKIKYDTLLSIYVLPYASTVALLDAMCGEMASLIRPGGRIVAVTINPDINRNPEYYVPYGLKFTPDDASKSDYEDCSRLRLDLNHRGYTGSVHAWYWKRSSIEQSLKRAGIHSINWHHLRATAFNASTPMPEALIAYSDHPHAIVIEGIAK